MAITSVTTKSPSPNDETSVIEFWVGQESMEVNVSSISPSIVQLIHQGLAFPGSEFDFSGNNDPTEKAILSWAVMSLKMDPEKMKKSCALLPFKPLEYSQKHGVMIGRNNDDSVHVHWKGAAEMILPMCSRYYDCHGAAKGIDDGERTKFEQNIRGMAASRCIAFAHRQVTEEEYDDLSETKKLRENDLTLLGLVGIKELNEKPAVVGRNG